ncbi:rhomboid family intramembrane serine protease [Pontibacter mangrovi]|uniref:rhomboid family intramembrane serine protease n=1 Tax=Pontibacter mangrovi TaxID=2589816 RepID=UPI0015E392D7|nr:rhomboid family intramembrane serine protease [Pontibacter mangrovi]
MEQEILQAPVTATILIITIAVSIAAFYNKKLKALFVLHPYSVNRGKRWHTLVTSSLVHSNWLHLLFNAFAVFIFSVKLEKDFVALSEWGHMQLLMLYFLSIFVSSGGTVVRYREDFWFNSLGASGGVLALICGFASLHPLDSMLIVPIIGSLPNIYYVIFILVGCVYATKKRPMEKIDHYGHLCGAIAGTILIFIFYPEVIDSIVRSL